LVTLESLSEESELSLLPPRFTLFNIDGNIVIHIKHIKNKHEQELDDIEEFEEFELFNPAEFIARSPVSTANVGGAPGVAEPIYSAGGAF
jgi:hypothetical protein